MLQDVDQPRYRTYTTLDDEVLDLGALPEDQQAYFARCYEAYRAGMSWEDFTHLSVGPNHPLLRETGGRITRAIYAHPLFKATHDLEDRLAIIQGEMAPNPGDDVSRDPIADEWIPAADAARTKGVTLPGLRQAIARGAIIAHPTTPGGTHLVVSANSLSRWIPDSVRQAARRTAEPAAV